MKSGAMQLKLGEEYVTQNIQCGCFVFCGSADIPMVRMWASSKKTCKNVLRKLFVDFLLTHGRGVNVTYVGDPISLQLYIVFLLQTFQSAGY